jgi:hypothetical protein
MRLVNHLNWYTGWPEQFYCEKFGGTISLASSPDFHFDNCERCPMFNGTLQGDGIECLYPDDTKEPFVVIRDAGGYAKERIAKKAEQAAKNANQVKHVVKGK